MSAALVLAAFAAATAALAPRHLLRAEWVLRSPSWGIWAWQAVSLTVALATFLIGLTLALPLLPASGQLAELIQSTHLDVTEHYRTPAGNWFAGTALAGALLLAGRTSALLVENLRRARRLRRSQVDALTLVGKSHPDGFVLVDHATPLVYSLPGRRQTVVVTRAALEALSEAELSSVLAHERTHLRARHDLALAVTDALARTFNVVRLFRVAHEQVAALIEMQADDAAHDVAARKAMARALVTLGTTVAPSHAAGPSPNAETRVRRLIDNAGPARARHRVAVGASTLALVTTPIALALIPAVEGSTHGCCHQVSPTNQPNRIK